MVASGKMRDVAFWSEYRPNVDSKACDRDNRRHRRAACGGCFLGWNINQVSRGKGPLGTRVFGVREVKGE